MRSCGLATNLHVQYQNVERGEGWDPEFRIREFAVLDPFDARARSKDVLLLFPLRITLPRSRTATGTTVVAGNQ